MARNSQNSIRKKLLGIMPRESLEGVLSSVPEPWHKTRAELITNALERWDDDTENEILKYVNRAFTVRAVWS